MQSNNADHRYDYAIAQMREQFQKFSEKCDMYNTSMTLPEGKDINLVDGRTYAYNGLSSFDPQEYFYRCFPGPMPYTSPFPFAPNSFTSMVHNSIAMWDSVSDFKNQNPDVQNLDAMKSRLAASGKTSILEEMKSIGFNLPGSVLYLGNSSLIDKLKTVDLFLTVYTGEYTYYGDIYDLQSGTGKKNVALLKLKLSTKGNGYKNWNTSNVQKLFTSGMMTFER